MTEQYIQAKISKRLESEGWLVIKLIKTTKNGIPDLMALKDGVARFIEVKKPNGKISEIQKYRIKELKTAGFIAEVWTDFEEPFLY